MADKRLLVATVNILKHLPPNEKKYIYTTSKLISEYISYFFICVKPFLTAYRTGTTVHPI